MPLSQKYNNFLLFICFVVIASFEVNAFEVSDKEVTQIAKDPYWQRLLHYQDGESIVGSKGFFLSKEGKINPELEIKKTIESFFDPNLSLKDDHAICRFPARLRWLQKKLKFSSAVLPKVKCKDFDEFKNKVVADNIDIIFAAENPNSIVSMMGHIFLKLSGKKKGGTIEHSLGYFAKFSKTMPVGSALMSIYPGIEGLYVLEPYRKRMGNYNDKQMRSIWEYRINLSKSQITDLLYHVWELKEIDVRYQFAGHNCGSALVYLLGIADIDIVANYDVGLSDAPVDIIKNLDNFGYIEKVDLVPSDTYLMRMIEGNFSKNQKNKIINFVKTGDLDLMNVGNKDKSQIIYAAEVFLDAKLLNDDIAQDRYDYLRRSLDKMSLNLPKNNLKYRIKNPLNKKNSSRINISYGDQGDYGSVINFGYYPVYNDLISDNSHYFNEIELGLANIEGRYYVDDEKLHVESFDFIKMKNLVPNTKLSGGISTAFKMNLERETLASNSGKMFFDSQLQFGLMKQFVMQNLKLYSLVGGGYSSFNSENVFYAKPEIGAIYIWPKSIGKLNLNYSKFLANHDYKYRDILAVTQSFYIDKDINIAARYQLNNTEFEGDVKEVSLDLYYYF